MELAPFDITVKVIEPWPVQTHMFRGVVPVGEPRVEQIAADIPVRRRLDQPAGVSHAVRFFCAAEAGFVHGRVPYVSSGTSVGGLTFQPAFGLSRRPGLTWRIPREGG